jgi:uncharacterized phiE125 gp8 family phage protein
MAWKPEYATALELAAYTRIPDNADDAQLALAISASSRSIDRHTRRQFGKVDSAEARVYTARWSRTIGLWVVPIDDVQTTTGLVVKVDTEADGTYATTITSGTYSLRPRNAAAEGKPWEQVAFLDTAAATPTGVDAEVQVTALFGWTSVPTTIKQACLLQASRFFARRGAPFGIAGSPDTGSEMRLLAKVDPDVAVSLEPYRKKARPR